MALQLLLRKFCCLTDSPVNASSHFSPVVLTTTVSLLGCLLLQVFFLKTCVVIIQPTQNKKNGVVSWPEASIDPCGPAAPRVPLNFLVAAAEGKLTQANSRNNLSPFFKQRFSLLRRRMRRFPTLTLHFFHILMWCCCFFSDQSDAAKHLGSTTHLTSIKCNKHTQNYLYL